MMLLMWLWTGLIHIFGVPHINRKVERMVAESEAEKLEATEIATAIALSAIEEAEVEEVEVGNSEVEEESDDEFQGNVDIETPAEEW